MVKIVAVVSAAVLLVLGLLVAVFTIHTGKHEAEHAPSSAHPRSAIFLSPSGQPATVTVGQTLSITDLELPVEKPSEAAPQPSGWTSRVTFKGCGQTASVRMHATGLLLLANGGTVNRYIRAGMQLPPNGSHLFVPRDWRELSFTGPGTYVITFTTATCTLWAPKIVVNVVP